MGIDGLNNDESPDDRGSPSADGFGGGAEQHSARKPDDVQLQEERRSREELYVDLRALTGADTSEEAGSSQAEDRTGKQQEFAEKSDEPCNTDDGGWEWKGLRLDPEANRIADSAISARRAAEGREIDGSYGDHGITPAMRRIEAQLEHGSLVPDTEKFALKSPDRFKEKLAKLQIRYPDRSPEGLASLIHDGIRYTFIFDTASYTDSFENTEAKLAEENFNLRLLKPSWDDPDYKGINSRWRDPQSKLLFEVQFHTPESWEAKQRTHDIYEKMSDPRTTTEQRAQLVEQQRKISASIPIPPGATDIAYYSAKEANE